MWYLIALGVALTWLIILISGTVIGYRCGHRAAIREMTMLADWESFRRSRREAFAQTYRDQDGGGVDEVNFHGASVPVQCYLEGTTSRPYGEPRHETHDPCPKRLRPRNRASALN